jgi:hypothetical protein
VRFANYYLAVKELQIPPRLAPNLLNRFTYPVFNYNYPLANIVSLPFSILGVHYQTTFKLLNISSVLLGIAGAYYFLRDFKYSRKARLFALVLFTLNPYTLTNILYRGNIGELMAWAILPWIFHFIFILKQENTQKIFNKVFLQLFFSLILFFLAHNIFALFGTTLVFIFLFFYFKKDLFNWKKFILIFLFALLSCLWFWLPALMEKKLVIMDSANISNNFANHFPTLMQLLNPNLSFGYSYTGAIDNLSFSLGMVQIIILFLSLIYLLRAGRKINFQRNNTIMIFFILSFFLIMFQLSFSAFLYRIIPFANFIQFPWRLSMLLMLTIVPISAFLFDILKREIKAVLLILIIIQYVIFFQAQPVDYFDKSRLDYELSPETTTVINENLPKTFRYEYFQPQESSLEIVDGEGTFQLLKWRGSIKQYELNLTSDSIIIEPTAYFPGWQTKVKNLDSKASWKIIKHTDNEVIAGRLAYRLPAGNYLVESRFTQKTWPRIVGNSLSVFSFLSLILIYFFPLKKAKNKEKK